MLKLYFLYDNMSTSLSNEYSTVRESITLNTLPDWWTVDLFLPLSLSLLLPLISFHIQASPSPDESAHTKMPLCFSVCQLYHCCAARLWQYCWKCAGTHGVSKQEFTVQSQEQPFPLQGRERERERARKRLKDWKVNSLCLLHLIEQICRVYRENFPMNTCSRAERIGLDWMASAASLQLYREFASWGSVKGWQRLGSEVTVSGKWRLDHIVISANNTSSLGVKFLYFRWYPAGIWAD